MVIDYINAFADLITFVFGLSQESGKVFISGSFIVLIVSWLCLCFYLLVQEPKLLEKWKYPTLSTISIVALLGIGSFLVSSSSILFMNLGSALTGDAEFHEFNFVSIIMFMVLYILFALFATKDYQDEKIKTEYIPKNLTRVIPALFYIFIVMLFLILGVMFIHYALDTGFLPPLEGITDEQAQWQKWFSAILFFVITIAGVIVPYVTKKKGKKE